jgi:hypothetical protein
MAVGNLRGYQGPGPAGLPAFLPSSSSRQLPPPLPTVQSKGHLVLILVLYCIVISDISGDNSGYFRPQGVVAPWEWNWDNAS